MHSAVDVTAMKSAREMLGAPETSAEASIALSCAWDMGYRDAHSLAEMARKMLTSPELTKGK